MNPENGLKLTNVSHQFNDEDYTFQNVSFHLGTGELGCLLGPSGTGKSTLLHCIGGFEQAKSGTIELDETELFSETSDLPISDRNIGVVFQEPSLFPHLNVEQNIAFGLFKKRKDEQKKIIIELIHSLKLEGLEKRFPHEISGGQQQRVALARAIAPRPKLLLLDEPFSGLDVLLRTEVLEEIRNFLKNQNMTSLMVTHDRDEAMVFCDKLGVLHNGSLPQWGEKTELFNHPKTPYIANFLGEGTLFQGMTESGGTIKTSFGGIISHAFPSASQGPVKVFLRPTDWILQQSGINAEIIQRKVRRGLTYLELQFKNGEVAEVLDTSGINSIGSDLHEKVSVGLKGGIIFPG